MKVWLSQPLRCNIRSRVRSGLAAARARGKRLGRPRAVLDVNRIASLRSKGLAWATIAAELGVGEGTVRRLAHASAKNPLPDAAVSRTDQLPFELGDAGEDAEDQPAVGCTGVHPFMQTHKVDPEYGSRNRRMKKKASAFPIHKSNF